MKFISLIIFVAIIAYLVQTQLETLNESAKAQQNCTEDSKDPKCQKAANKPEAVVGQMCEQMGQVYDPKINGCVPKPAE